MGPCLDMYQLVESWIACGGSFASPSLALVGSLLLRAMFVRVSCVFHFWSHVSLEF